MNTGRDIWVRNNKESFVIDDGPFQIESNTGHAVEINRFDENGLPLVEVSLWRETGLIRSLGALRLHAKAELHDAQNNSDGLRDLAVWMMCEANRGEAINAGLGVIDRMFERYFGVYL